MPYPEALPDGKTVYDYVICTTKIWLFVAHVHTVTHIINHSNDEY